MSDELKPRESVDSPEFRRLVDEIYGAGFYSEADTKEVAALIAHIDAWGARLAGDADKTVCLQFANRENASINGREEE